MYDGSLRTVGSPTEKVDGKNFRVPRNPMVRLTDETTNIFQAS